MCPKTWKRRHMATGGEQKERVVITHILMMAWHGGCSENVRLLQIESLVWNYSKRENKSDISKRFHHYNEGIIN